MSFQEKSTWIMGVVTVVAYAVYLTVVLGRAGEVPVDQVSYAGALLWTIAAVIVASIVAHIVAAIASPGDADQHDQRDREIARHGDYTGHWVVAVGAMAALGMSLLQLGHFWIANVIYLAFVLATLTSSVARIVAYRRGFQQW